MTRKHFEAIAAILAKAPLKESEGEVDLSIESERIFAAGVEHATGYIGLILAAFFASENPNFDRQRFLDAAGIKE